MKTTSVAVMVFFFQSTILKLLGLAMFKVLSQQLQDTLTTVFETIHYGWRFYGHGSPYELILSWVNIFKWKSAKVPGLISCTQKSEPALQRTMHKDISLIINNKWNVLLQCFFKSRLGYKFRILLFR